MKPMEPFLGRPATAQETKQFQAYVALLRQWNPKINLVAPSTLKDAEVRHVGDSLQLLPHLPVKEGLEVLDVGAGAGLPGLILAMAAPQHRFTLAERDQRKCAFLHTAVHSLGLKNVSVHAADVKTLQKQYDVITSRAWASLPSILEITAPLLKPEGQWLLLKGQALDVELRGCETSFHLTAETFASKVPSIDGGHGWVIRLDRARVKLDPSSTGNP